MNPTTAADAVAAVAAAQPWFFAVRFFQRCTRAEPPAAMPSTRLTSAFLCVKRRVVVVVIVAIGNYGPITTTTTNEDDNDD